MNRKPLSTLVLAVAMSTVTACGSTAAPDDEGEPPIDVRPVSTYEQMDLPLLRHAPTQADQRAYFAAVNQAKQECAAEYGVTVNPPVAEQSTFAELSTGRRYGVLNAEEVTRYGYEGGPGSAGSLGGESEEKGDPGGWNPSRRELIVLRGKAPGGEKFEVDPATGEELPKYGCASEGFRRIDKGQTSPVRNPVVEELLIKAMNLTKADSRAQAAADRWSKCMAERGYDFDRRWEAGNSLAGASKEKLKAMAKLDLRCGQKANYVAVWHAVDVAYQKRLIEENQSKLLGVREEHERVMDRVRETLEGSS